MIRHQETGILFEPGNFTQLREFCQYLFADPDKSKRMGQEGRIWVRNQLSEEKHYNILAPLFEKLIEINKSLK
jgi:glycosyltransferase involved in cell wall biosynthesis